ncbi:hypothetical protein MKW92_020349 [Papaver armeniacum]|nr:hypothetical protein MKW92_020349 [Papaver armeniacum]
MENKKMKKKTTDEQSMLLGCKLYISESRNLAALDSIERAAALHRETVIMDKFEDRVYNRVRYTLVSYVIYDSSTDSPIYSPLQQTVLAMVEAAYQAINLEHHSGAHPTLGVVDGICFHPLGREKLEEAAWLAKLVARDISNQLQAANPTGKTLDAIRRDLGYFRPNYMGSQWAGWALPEVLNENPDEGPTQVPRARGIVIIGASPWVRTFNIPVMSTDVSITRRIACKVSARGGGIPTVQAIGLVHGEDSTEIACYLLEPNRVRADLMQNQIGLLAAEEGLDVEKGYFTDYSPEMILEKYKKLVSKINN